MKVLKLGAHTCTRIDAPLYLIIGAHPADGGQFLRQSSRALDKKSSEKKGNNCQETCYKLFQRGVSGYLSELGS
jgi:hypothetical protein